MDYIIFAIVGLVEIGPNLCRVDYMRYVDVQSVTLPCDLIKKENIDAKSI
jgi:hypothetical protein